jgi:SpoVK/Ycf46/Vps4 family AAA+-type ATPase
VVASIRNLLTLNGISMARSDLLFDIIQAGFNGDQKKLKKAVAATIAEEKAKQHTVLATRLENLVQNSSIINNSINDKPIYNENMTNLAYETIPEKKLADIVLPEAIINICNEFINEHMRCDLLRSYNLEPRHRILLVGPPGTGKTSLAEAIAESLMIPLLSVRYENVIGSYLGETASKIQKLIDHASSKKCVLFFDEFETLGKERGDEQETGEIKRVVSSLLIQIDSLPSHVIVMGATNHPELLDRAAWRRFQVRMELPLPNKSAINEWFRRFELKLNAPLGYTYNYLSEKLIGFNFSEIEEFGQSVFRNYILEQPNISIKESIKKTLKHLEHQQFTLK